MVFKRILSGLLVLCVVFSLLPMNAAAAENVASAVSNEQMSITGTNGFGKLLSAEISAAETEEDTEFEAGYSVTALDFSGRTATVTFDAMSEAVLVVAVYTEDGLQMLASGNTTVSPEETETTVTILGEMPQYFYATAFLMDTYDYSPLCEEYSTPMCTQEMQALLASTVDDYDADRVYNLDDDKTTNFAVFAEDTIVVEEQAGVNTVASADDENMVYVIENADETITSLTEGDILAYPYGDAQILIVKVATITVSGTTATITGAELEMEEVFEAVKIETGADSDKITVDPSGADEGITYEGLREADMPEARSSEASGSKKWSHSFKIDKQTEYTSPSEDVMLEAEINGSLSFSLSVDVKFYISFTHQYLEAGVSGDAELSGSISGKARFDSIKLGSFGVSPVAGVYISLNPTVTVEFEGEASITIAYGFKLGFAVEHRSGSGMSMQNRSSAPKLTSELKFEGTIFFGVDMRPKIAILSDAVAKAEMTDLVGFEIKGTMEYNNGEPEEDADCIHGCTSCVDGEVTFKVEVSVSVQFLKSEKLKFELKIIDISKKLKDFYWSLDHGTAGLTSCPYRSYRISVEVTDLDGNIVPGAEVTMSNDTSEKTNDNGIAIFYLPTGGHTASTEIEGTSYSVDFVVLRKARKVSLSPYSEDEDFGILGTLDDTGILAFGQCGGDVSWILYSNGRMEISGSGAVESRTWTEYMDYITVLDIQEGVTSVCKNAFSGAIALRELIIADSVTTLGLNAFNGCTGLTDVTMPCDISITVTTGYGASNEDPSSFTGCTNVRKIHYTYGRTGIMPNRSNAGYDSADFYEFTLEWKCRGSLQTVILDEGITHIADYAFYKASSLAEAVIPASVDSIGYYAFSGCKSLKNINWPEAIVFLGDGAFQSCETFTEIDLPSTLTTIRKNTFSGCTGLTAVEIPDSVTTLGLNAFNGCIGLTEVTMPCDISITVTTGYGASNEDPSSFTGCTNVRKIHYTYGRTGIMPNRTNAGYDSADFYEFTLEWKCRGSLQTVILDEGITHIADYAFYKASSLTEAVIPASVDSIGNYAFSGCKSLKNINWPDQIVFLGDGAFQSCETFTEIDLPSTLTTIRKNTFSGCTGLTAVEIPDSVTTLGLNAFNGCTGLKEVTMPCDISIAVTTGYGASNEDPSSFTGCTNVRKIHYTYGRTGIMPNRTNAGYDSADFYEFTLEWKSRDRLKTVIFDDGITQIGNYAFYKATRLSDVILPSTLDTVGDYSFASCTALTELTFTGDEPFIDDHAFNKATITCFYPADNDTWTEGALLSYGGTITWTPYTLDGEGNMVINEAAAVTVEPNGEEAPDYEEMAEETAPSEEDLILSETEQDTLQATLPPVTDDLIVEEQPTEEMEPDANYGGDYTTEVVDNSYILKTASFSGLVPGEEYVMLAMVSIETEDPLAADNLLYIAQGTAEADGTLVFQYVQRVNTDISYVVACGASNKNLKDAVITFPDMAAADGLQAVDPTVVYGGETLIEGVDYEITGTVDFSEPGEYTCYIRGIHNYTGTVKCVYTVVDQLGTLGDVDDNGEIDIFDANLIAAYYNEVMDLTEAQLSAADVNGDGDVNIFDANLVAAYYNEVIDAFPAE